MKQEKVVIIGAGVAGLVAAIHCEEAGYAPLILEADAAVGGRVQCTSKKGYILDHGFQVLLTNYEEARRYLDFTALDLHAFGSGAIIFYEGKNIRVADPLRAPQTAFQMLTSSVGSLRDKWLMFKLTQSLKRQNRSAIFKPSVGSTIAFLQQYGFSSTIIERFFRPFFGGIFLENELKTSASMFQFVFKMFAEGEAAIPAAGIGAIPTQLASKLEKSEIRLNTRVKQIQGNDIQLENGESITFDKLIIATDPAPLLPNLAGQACTYVNTCNLYYSANESPLNSNLIALVSNENSRINNFCVLSDVASSYAKQGSLVSVTLKDIPAPGTEDPFYEEIAQEIKALTGTQANLEFLHRIDIPKALPINEDLAYTVQNTQLTLTNDIYLAGDYLLNASLDAAMRSGRLAAQAMMDSI